MDTGRSCRLSYLVICGVTAFIRFNLALVKPHDAHVAISDSKLTPPARTQEFLDSFFPEVLRHDALFDLKSVNFSIQQQDCSTLSDMLLIREQLVSTKALTLNLFELIHQFYFLSQQEFDPLCQLITLFHMSQVFDSQLNCLLLHLSVARVGYLKVALNGHVDVTDAFIAKAYCVPCKLSLVEPFGLIVRLGAHRTRPTSLFVNGL